MKSNSTLHIIPLLFFVQIGFAQKTVSKEILGQIFEKQKAVEGVTIINNTSQVTTISDVNGMFSIEIKEGDVLVFSAVNLEPLKRRITSDDLESGKLQITMIIKEIELKEVVVNENATITTEKLGIVPEGQKTYTPAERKLATAGDLKAIDFLGLLGGSMKLDPVINKINGRTAKLKKLIEVERKELNIEKLGYLFEDSYYTDYLKIPSDYVSGFKFHIVENQEVCDLLKENNKTKLTPLMSELALKYKEIIASDIK